MTPDFLSSWRLEVTPLAPVHVGSGEDMDPTGYVLDADALFEISPSTLAAALDGADREKLLGLVDCAEAERALVGVRRFLHERREGLVAHASRTVRVAPGVQELYEARIGTIAQAETKAINRLEIERTFSRPDTRAPILPGSSLKGAIRTALLSQENAGRERRDRERSRELQQRLFGYRGFETDPMRLVHVADAMSTRHSTADDLATDTAVTFAVNRKRRRITGKDGREVRSQAERKGLYQTLEVVPPMRWRAFRGGLTLNRSDLSDARRLPRTDLRWCAEEIASACNRFYRPLFKREAEALHERGLLDERWYTVVQRLMKDGPGDAPDSNRAFLLRVGRHSGAESVTLDGVRNIRIMTPQDQPDREEEEATTWWLASDRIDASSGLLPFGWILVEMVEDDGALALRSELAAAIDSFHAESGEQEWRAKVEQRRLTLRQEQEAAASRRAEAERRRREHEAAEREHEAKRAAMTDEERELDDLRTLFAETRRPGARPQTQGGELAGRAVQLLGVAKEWPEALRFQAANLIEDIFRTVGFPKGKKGRERKQRILDLREGE